MKTRAIKLPDVYIEVLERFVQEGRFATVSEAIRFAVRDLILSETLSSSRSQRSAATGADGDAATARE